MARGKHANLRVLVAILMLATLLDVQAVIAADISPCQGMNQNLSENYKADLARAITKQLNASHPALKITSVSVLRSFASGNWSIIHVKFPPNVAEDVYLFYVGNPLTSRYVTEWGTTQWFGATMFDDKSKVREWALKKVPGIPPKLASCFAWYVTKGR